MGKSYGSYGSESQAPVVDGGQPKIWGCIGTGNGPKEMSLPLEELLRIAQEAGLEEPALSITGKGVEICGSFGFKGGVASKCGGVDPFEKIGRYFAGKDIGIRVTIPL